MDNVLFVARIFGPLLAILSFWHLTYRKEAHKVIDHFKKTPALIYLGGALNLFLGLLIITFVPDWGDHFFRFIIPLFGWFLFIRAILVLFFPGFFSFLFKYTEVSVVIMGLIGLVWGIFMTWYGFIHQLY